MYLKFRFYKQDISAQRNIFQVPESLIVITVQMFSVLEAFCIFFEEVRLSL